MEEFHMPLKENFQELVQHGKSRLSYTILCEFTAYPR